MVLNDESVKVWLLRPGHDRTEARIHDPGESDLIQVKQLHPQRCDVKISVPIGLLGSVHFSLDFLPSSKGGK